VALCRGGNDGDVGAAFQGGAGEISAGGANSPGPGWGHARPWRLGQLGTSEPKRDRLFKLGLPGMALSQGCWACVFDNEAFADLDL
jgi:hypothetical protein